MKLLKPLKSIKLAYDVISTGDYVNVIHDYEFWFWLYSTYAIDTIDAKRLFVQNDNRHIKSLKVSVLNEEHRNAYHYIKCEYKLRYFPIGFSKPTNLNILSIYEFFIFDDHISITRYDGNIKYKRTWIFDDLMDELERLILQVA